MAWIRRFSKGLFVKLSLEDEEVVSEKRNIEIGRGTTVGGIKIREGAKKENVMIMMKKRHRKREEMERWRKAPKRGQQGN